MHLLEKAAPKTDINKQLNILAILWCDWNEGFIQGDIAMSKLPGLFPEMLEEWRARMKTRKGKRRVNKT